MVGVCIFEPLWLLSFNFWINYAFCITLGAAANISSLA